MYFVCCECVPLHLCAHTLVSLFNDCSLLFFETESPNDLEAMDLDRLGWPMSTNDLLVLMPQSIGYNHVPQCPSTPFYMGSGYLNSSPHGFIEGILLTEPSP